MSHRSSRNVFGRHINLRFWSHGSAHSSGPRWYSGRHRPVYDTSYWIWGCGENVASRGHRNQPSITSEQPQPRADVDFCKDANRTAHHTSQYEVEQLVVRRGQPFELKIKLDKSFEKEKEKIRLQFSVGSTPQRSKNTLVWVPQVASLNTSKWGFVVESVDDSAEGVTLNVTVMAPCDAIVGEYTVQVQRCPTDKTQETPSLGHTQKQAETIYILFNAWCKDDVVCLNDEEERNEYVLNDSGRVYVGSASFPYGRGWMFGQFDKVCLEAAVYLLEASYLATEAHGNVIQVTRALSAMVNSNDQDKGVLTGNWSGNYTGGVSPSKWNSSVNILTRYMKQKRAVRYGQCWVFSAVLTTLGRTLGIPTRSVTNFASAHDTDLSMTIDTHIDMNGRSLSHLDDSVWNFHVWNESWFRRQDLPDGNDGWQAYDSTPQERSDNMMRCGPAPVAAIKDGNVFFEYDTKFIFGEVNGDRLTWRADSRGSGDMHVVGKPQTSAVGKSISTKAVTSNFRNDITENYKYPEGSEEERDVVAKVSRYSSRKVDLEEVYEAMKNDDVEFDFKGAAVKDGILISVSTQSRTEEARSVHLRLYAMARYYTGVTAEELESKEVVLELEANQVKMENWKLDPASYLNKLDEDASVVVYAYAEVGQTSQIFAEQRLFDMEKPDLQIDMSNNVVKLGDQFQAVVNFTNPLAVPLTNASLTVEGLGIPAVTVTFKKPIQQDQTVTETVNLVPRLVGKKEVFAMFYSKQLSGVDGSASVLVVKQ